MRKIQKDHQLMVRTRQIEEEISNICKEFEEEFGVFAGWTGMRELAAGMPLSQLLGDDQQKIRSQPDDTLE